MADFLNDLDAIETLKYLKHDLLANSPYDKAVNRAIDTLSSVNRWISCSERLPEVYEKVLTYNDEGIIHDNFRLNLRDGSVGWSQGCGITHWQPRPEPPEREVQNG